MDEPRFFDIVEHFDLDAARRAHGGNEFVAVRRFAHGRRCDGSHVARSLRARETRELTDGRDAARHRFFPEITACERIASA